MSYVKHIQKAIDYIENNLNNKLEISDISKHIAFSHWYFQRIFCSVTGDTVKDYIRNRRLTNACKDLSETKKRIIDIAFDYQFESQESFSRAFKKLFGINPGQYRNHQISLPLYEKLRLTDQYLENLYRSIKMEPKIIEWKQCNVIGMSANFISICSDDKNNFAVIPTLWEIFNSNIKNIDNKKSSVCLGIYEPVPEFYRQKDGELVYTACTEVEKIDSIPKGMIARTIPDGKYAVFTHKGKLINLENTIRYIYGSWFNNSNYHIDNRPEFELYDQRFNPVSDDSEFDIYVPIKDKE